MIDNFENLQNFISFNGLKLDAGELENIKLERYKYIRRAKQTNVINYTKQNFDESNLQIQNTNKI